MTQFKSLAEMTGKEKYRLRAAEMRNRHANGESKRSLSLSFGINRKQVREIVGKEGKNRWA